MQNENPQITNFKDNQNPNPNPNSDLEESLFCPSGKCLKIPEITYLYNPYNSVIKYKCQCNNNYEQPINITIQDFISKSSNLLCYNCKKILKGQNFSFCCDCNNIFDNYCKQIHYENTMHFNCIEVDKNNMFNYCLEHKCSYIFRCFDCNISLCGKCDILSHGEHNLEQIKKCAFNQKEFEYIKSNFERQNNILTKIKTIINDHIATLENDIKLKQMIINNYQKYKNDYNSVINLKNLYINNEEKYENILLNFLNNNSNNENNDKNYKEEEYIDKILLLFYYSLMINKDKDLNMKLINTLKRKLNEHFNFFDNNINDFNFDLNPIITNANNIHNIQNIEKNRPDDIINNENILSNMNNPFNQSLSFMENKNFINSLNLNNNNMYNPQNIRYENILDQKIDDTKSFGKNQIHNSNEKIENPKKQKYKDKFEDNSEKKKKLHPEYVNNMISLKSGNFAISIKRRVEIYDLKRINISGKNKVFNDEAIKIRNCRIQKIYPSEKIKGKFISYIYQFEDETLLCPIYSQIIRIRLTNKDRDYIKLSPIILDNGELTRKLISLGDSLLVILSKKNKECFIRVYNKVDESQKIVNDNINIINNILSNNLDANNNTNNIKEEPPFEIIEKNINESKISWVSIFGIKKVLKNQIFSNIGIKNSNYSYKFIATSNSNYESGLGENKIIFYRVRKDYSGKYFKDKLGEIDGISCSTEPDSICQLNEQYLCVGIQNNNDQLIKYGFALIDINKIKICKFIEGYNTTSLYYDKENSLLISAIEKLEGEDKSFLTQIYKVIINKREGFDDEIEFEPKIEHTNSQNYYIISIKKVILDSNKDYIFATYSKDCELEIAAKVTEKLQ